MSKYKIVRKDANKSYGLYRVGPKCHRIVKNLKDYSDEQEAISDLIKLLDGEIKERDMIGGSFEQDAEAGKQGNRILCLEAALEGIGESLAQALGDGMHCKDCDRLEKAVREAVKRINELVGERKDG